MVSIHLAASKGPAKAVIASPVCDQAYENPTGSTTSSIALVHRPCDCWVIHMPSRRVQKAPRKRSGCGSCKSAHVKCSEEKPACKRCQRLTLSCQYEFRLVWEEDSLQRNIVHGRAGVWSRHGRKIEPLPGSLGFSDDKENLFWIPLPARGNWQFNNFFPEDFVNGLPLELQEEGFPDESVTTAAARLPGNHIGLAKIGGSIRKFGRNLSETTNSNILGVVSEGIAPGCTTHHPLPLTTWAFDTVQTSLPPSLPIISVSDVDSQLLGYYIYDLSPKCSLNAHLNPYLNVLLPVAYEFEPLRNTLLAAAACQLYHLSGNRQYELHSLRHRSKAILGLNGHLNKERMDWKSLATMVMFCFRDVCVLFPYASCTNTSRSPTVANHLGLPISRWVCAC